MKCCEASVLSWLEQGFQRAGDDEKLLAFGPFVVDLMKEAAELAATTDYDGAA